MNHKKIAPNEIKIKHKKKFYGCNFKIHKICIIYTSDLHNIGDNPTLELVYNKLLLAYKNIDPNSVIKIIGKKV